MGLQTAVQNMSDEDLFSTAIIWISGDPCPNFEEAIGGVLEYMKARADAAGQPDSLIPLLVVAPNPMESLGEEDGRQLYEALKARYEGGS